jgi:hypothetical protein
VPKQRNPWDRLKGETPKAYAAFRVYRDLGPDNRSIDKCFISQSHSKATAERAHREWFNWSRDNRWVERAIAWDDHCGATADAEFQKRLREKVRKQADFAIEEFNRLVDRVRKADRILDKADVHPITDVEQETDNGDGTRKRTKVKGINFAGYASLMKEIRESANRAILGPREENEGSTTGEPVRKIEWDRPSE